MRYPPITVLEMQHSRTWACIAGLTTLLALAGCASGKGAAPATSTSPSTSTSTPAAVPVTVPPRTGDIGPTAAAELAPEPVEVAYGPDPMQKMDVYATKGEALGTIMYVHGGGWNGGSKDHEHRAGDPVDTGRSAEHRVAVVGRRRRNGG